MHETCQSGAGEALLVALRHVVEAQGTADCLFHKQKRQPVKVGVL
jgi:hypothetical protein